MPDYLPRFRGHAITFTASGSVTGGRLVAIASAWAVSTAADNSPTVIGVAGFDVEAGEKVTVYTRAGGGHRLLAAGAIPAGSRVCAASAGRVRVATGGENAIGTTLSAGTDGGMVEVLF